MCGLKGLYPIYIFTFYFVLGLLAAISPLGILEVLALNGSSTAQPNQRENQKVFYDNFEMPVIERRGIAVIADFQNSSLEDWQGDGIQNVADLRAILVQMEAHWQWLSRNTEEFQWHIQRVRLPVDLGPAAFGSWWEFREAVSRQLEQQVNVADYDLNGGGFIDSVWIVVSNNGQEYEYMIGGASITSVANVFVDAQNSTSVIAGAFGNFNHELGHTLGLPDLYGPYGTISYLSMMADSWPVPPSDLTAYERVKLGWLSPRVISETTSNVQLSSADKHFDAVLVPTIRDKEYFLIENRRRPDSGFGSVAPPSNGLAVYQVFEISNQTLDPPLLKLQRKRRKTHTLDRAGQ
ncbi:hypothetical protein [Wenzhouxiangella limi]|uniref:Uncharacterized protein n=1 Tax=Wenzhouxiangella limi TaxID=2707351 RepID=A0A845UVX4_9GAMM|nr:hypothetical protein [Wenzhouxiangella limi]NDY94392.1 hypothetical protein [Wenzhouxiangella limi]